MQISVRGGDDIRPPPDGDPTVEDRLLTLVDRQAIHDCIIRYCRGVDRLDEQLIRSAFHPGAVDHHGSTSGSVDDFLGAWLPRQDEREATQHHITNQFVELEGDSAYVETYYIAIIKIRARADGEVHGGRYVDRLERRAGAWKIVHRVVIPEWVFSCDAELMKTVLVGAPRGARDRSDISYHTRRRHNPSVGDGDANRRNL